MSAKIEEKYFAIRVGNPRKHRCYLWVGEDGSVPRLFLSLDLWRIGGHLEFSNRGHAMQVRWANGSIAAKAL